MRLKHPILASFSTIALVGCASSPWPHYEEAIRCHLDGKTTECDQKYQKAIKADPKTQGVHASYGVHLLKEGKTAEAAQEFATEQANYPDYAPKAISQLDNRAKTASDSTAHRGTHP